MEPDPHRVVDVEPHAVKMERSGNCYLRIRKELHKHDFMQQLVQLAHLNLLPSEEISLYFLRKHVIN